MVMCRLTVSAPDGVWQGEVDTWGYLVILAALSAEPESVGELARAAERYQPPHWLPDRLQPKQWSRQSHAVPALPADSVAYRLGGFGTTEIVIYFDLVRELLAEAWELSAQEPRPTLPELVERLAEFQDWWLQTPNEETGPGMTPAELIEAERRRMPVTGDGSHLDCDCPICQAMAEGDFGPMFLSFDGHHLELEDEFAFSLCVTRDEWEREQEEYQRFSEEMDRKRCEEAMPGEGEGVPWEDDAANPPAGSVWQSSFVNWDGLADTGALPGQALLALGFPLAELTANLRDRTDGRDLMRRLNEAYRGLGAPEGPAAQEFRAALEEVSRTFPDLTSKCADLQSRLDEVLRLLA